MCGRYAASANVGELVEEFDVDLDRTAEPTRSLLRSAQQPPAGSPDFNMAPTKLAPVVLTRAAKDHPSAVSRQLRLLSWGLVPAWSKDPSGSARMINARAETVRSKPAFAKAVSARRCLVPAVGWYEWQVSPTALDAKGKPRKQPFFIERADGDLLAMAGIYEFWRDPTVAEPDDPAAWLVSFSVLTTAAEPGLDRIHDRQPLVVEDEDRDRWLDPGADVDVIVDLLTTGRPGRFTAYPVGRAVGSNRANGPGLIEPAPEADLVGVVDPTTGEVIGG